MSVKDVLQAVKVIDLRDADRTWFPKWIQGYAKLLQADHEQTLALSTDSVIEHEAVQQMYRKLRLLHHPINNEKT